MSAPKLLWAPTPERIAAANLTGFRTAAAARWGVDLPDYGALWRWSIDRRAEFWQSVWADGGVIASRPADQVLVDGERMPGARWFVGARLNFAENLLRGKGDGEAIVFTSETGARRALSFAALRAEVARIAGFLAEAGVGAGDRVAGFLPNMPETIVAFLASASRGAIWTSCSPDFGAQGVLDRFGQVEPKVLFVVDGYAYNGKWVDCRDKVVGIRAELPSARRVVIVPYQGGHAATDGLRDGIPWADAGRTSGPITFAQMPFDHPLVVMYSSGTTGVPKCIVHGAGGTLLQHLKEHRLHTDVKPGDRVFYFTTCGWMMWNWLVSALAARATVVLFDGSPFHPGPEALWDMAARERVTVFGTSAKYIAALQKAGFDGRGHELGPLKAVLSTGSPLAPEGFDYVYQAIKRDVQLASISGGTDIISCFALGNPVAPVWRGELQTRGLGMAVDVFDDDGQPVRGRQGELVCTKPFPSMPVGFWNDPDGAKYHSAYFARFPNVWHHGDFAAITDRDGLIITGRSDAVLNPGGVRIGTAEIYRQVEAFDDVQESICVGQDWQGDVRVVLFVRMKDGRSLTPALVGAIKARIRRNCTPRHVPAHVLAIADIPRTVSGKITELAVRDIIHGRTVKNREALANPGALDFYKDLPELRS
ncbi:MAG: acetoacetate--CoA ligase [Alphaproteobacteria bacterium]